MSCRRALEIDLAAMLRGEDGPEQRDFRGHYPRCRECAAEVDAFTTVHGLLTATATDTHPNPKKLLWYVDRPQSLSATERNHIAAHTVECRSCRDEMTTLKGLDLHALTRPLAGIHATAGPPSPPVPVPGAAPATPWWRTLGWPRLAFVMVAMGLVPLLTSRLGPPPASAPPMAGGAGSEPAPDTHDAPAQIAAADDAPAAAGAVRAPAAKVASEPAPRVASTREQPATAKPVREAPTTAIRERAIAPAPPPPAERRPTVTGAAGGVVALAPNPGTRSFDGEAGAVDGQPTLLARRNAAPAAAAAESAPEPAAAAAPSDARDEGDADAPGGSTPRTVRLRPSGSVHIAADEHAALTILTPARTPDLSQTEADVRIVDAGARRELRQQGTLVDGGVATTVTGGWLTPGDYQIEVRVGGVLTIYRLTVDR